MTGKCGFGLGLTAKTVIIISLVTVVALGTTMLTGQAFTRLHGQVESILDNQLEQLMTSVRLMQQTESLISLGLIFSRPKPITTAGPRSSSSMTACAGFTSLAPIWAVLRATR